MTKSVNLYLATGVSEGVGFWVVNFTEEENYPYKNRLVLATTSRQRVAPTRGENETRHGKTTSLFSIASKRKKIHASVVIIIKAFERGTTHTTI